MCISFHLLFLCGKKYNLPFWPVGKNRLERIQCHVVGRQNNRKQNCVAFNNLKKFVGTKKEIACSLHPVLTILVKNSVEQDIAGLVQNLKHEIIIQEGYLYI